jgi:hypothetical protein
MPDVKGVKGRKSTIAYARTRGPETGVSFCRGFRGSALDALDTRMMLLVFRQSPKKDRSKTASANLSLLLSCRPTNILKIRQA